MYKKMYFLLFNKITDALSAIRERDYKKAEALLCSAQCEAEKIFIEANESE